MSYQWAANLPKYRVVPYQGAFVIVDQFNAIMEEGFKTRDQAQDACDEWNKGIRN